MAWHSVIGQYPGERDRVYMDANRSESAARRLAADASRYRPEVVSVFRGKRVGRLVAQYVCGIERPWQAPSDASPRFDEWSDALAQDGRP